MLNFPLIVFSLGLILLFIFMKVVIRPKYPILRTIGNVLEGSVVLWLVNITGAFTGITIPISLLSLLIAALCGIPGITTMVLLNTIFN